jgi:hypothetical protein
MGNSLPPDRARGLRSWRTRLEPLARDKGYGNSGPLLAGGVASKRLATSASRLSSSSWVSIMANDLFESAYLLLDRACEHRNELERRAKAFLDSASYTVFKDVDPKTGEYLRKLRLTDKIPGFLFPIVGDVLNNLRCALDHTACACALASDPRADLTGVSFPFGSRKAEFEKRMGPIKKKIPHEIAAIMAALEPYEGGNNLLWALSALSNASKHRRLIAVGAQVRTINWNALEWTGRSPTIRPEWDSEKGELIFGRSAEDFDLDHDLEPTFFITLDDVKIFKGVSALALFRQMTSHINGIVDALKGETARIFPGSP